MIVLHRILVPTDFSEHARQAVKYAAAFAEKFGAEIHLLHVLQDLAIYQPDAVTIGPPVVPPLAQLAAAARTSLERFIADNKLERLAVQQEVREGTPVEEIIEFAAEKDIDLIILGTHGRGWLAHVLLGSVAEKVVRKAPCPVLTVRLAEHEFVKPDE
ncbi:MAG: universal stress protein [Planctomycetes bacterium]|nr:universal stress protein [Planctomycetota bacterium]